MKRIMILLCAIGIAAMSSTCLAGMSSSRVRKETRFLTDKMAYELNLSTAQYNDAYEINYDFVYSIRDLMDDVVRGYEWAQDRYYRALDIRNDDLRWVLSSGQYRKFIGLDYFYRPVYASGGRWNFRIYINYTNHNHFYFGKPYHYNSYRGGHCRVHYDNPSYYRGRYHHDFYTGRHSVRDDRVYRNNRRSDFGSVAVRPGTSTRPGSSVRPGTPATRPGNPSIRPGNDAVARPGTPAVRPSTRPNSPATRPGTSSRPDSGRKEEVKREKDSNRRGSSTRKSSSNDVRKESATPSRDRRSENSSRRSSRSESSVSNSNSSSSGRGSSRSSENKNNRQKSSRSSEKENGGRR